MIRCVRCNTELADTARFCASCGAAVAETKQPASVTRVGAGAGGPQISIKVPDQVDPLGATASPSSVVNPFGTTKRPALAEKPIEPPVVSQTPVSPLASSAAHSQRGAFQEAMDSAQAPSAPEKKKVAATQMMSGAPVRPPVTTPATPAKKAVAKTVALGNWTPPKSAPPSAPAAAPSSPKIPASVAAPSAPAPSHAGHPQPAPSGPGGWGWNAPARGYAFAPGAHVQVTWSNGQRYPAVVAQVSGAQCLVVFPDGQQHWVETHFLSG